MPLENQVVSLELAQKLKELGVKQESLYYYCGGHKYYSSSDDGEYEECPAKNDLVNEKYCDSAGLTMEYAISAFTVAELGEMFQKIGAELFIKAYGEVFGFKGTQMVGTLGVINLTRQPDRMAKMLIYLLENKLITL